VRSGTRASGEGGRVGTTGAGTAPAGGTGGDNQAPGGGGTRRQRSASWNSAVARLSRSARPQASVLRLDCARWSETESSRHRARARNTRVSPAEGGLRGGTGGAEGRRRAGEGRRGRASAAAPEGARPAPRARSAAEPAPDAAPGGARAPPTKAGGAEAAPTGAMGPTATTDARSESSRCRRETWTS